jgi:hypothetical protein
MKPSPFAGAPHSRITEWRRHRVATRAAMVSMLALLLTLIGLVAAAAALVRADAVGVRAIAAVALLAAAGTAAWARSVRRQLADLDREIAFLVRGGPRPRQRHVAPTRDWPAAVTGDARPFIDGIDQTGSTVSRRAGAA